MARPHGSSSPWTCIRHCSRPIHVHVALHDRQERPRSNPAIEVKPLRVLRVASPHGDDEPRGVGGGLVVHELVAPLEPGRGEAQLAEGIVLVRVDTRLEEDLSTGLYLVFSTLARST